MHSVVVHSLAPIKLSLRRLDLGQKCVANSMQCRFANSLAHAWLFLQISGDSRVQYVPCSARAETRGRLESPMLREVVADEEVLDLSQCLGMHFFQVADSRSI